MPLYLHTVDRTGRSIEELFGINYDDKAKGHEENFLSKRRMQFSFGGWRLGWGMGEAGWIQSAAVICIYRSPITYKHIET